MLVEREDRLDEAVAAFLEAKESGETFDHDAWLQAYPDLCDELKRFLADHDSFDHCMAPLRAVAADTPRPARPLSDSGLIAGRKIGDYELLHELGRGGMGIVFKAREIALNRIVALKMIRAGALATADDLRRFQREAMLVARLDHPNIVSVYQAGTADGLSFISLRLVEGGSLARRRDEFRDPTRAAQLVATIARAVDFAHRHGILHRDLKPGNILLESDSTPYVTDFGLARSIDASDTTSSVLGTPAYMAPEQATGTDVTTAADIYSLGAILYELLTGRVPFHGQTAFGMLLEAVNHEPERPRRLDARVDRDLETICMKCLEKEPSRRYESASALADDLERWLRREPVMARSVGPAGRLARWARRNPLPAGLSLGLALAFAVGISLIVWQWQRAERNLADSRYHQQRADDGRRDARQVLDEFCIRLSDDRLSKLPGTGPIRQELLQSGLRYYQHFLEQNSDDPLARQDVADAHARLGILRGALGAKPAARQEYEKAIELYASLPISNSVRRMAASAYNNLGNLLSDVGEIEAAESSLRSAERLWAEILADHPDSLEAVSGRAKALANLALLLQERGDTSAGRQVLAEAHELQIRMRAARPKDPDVEVDLGSSFNTMANNVAALGLHAEEFKLLQQAKAHFEAAERLAPWDEKIQLKLAQTQRGCAGSLWALGKHDEAEAEYAQARVRLESLINANPDGTNYKGTLAMLLTNIAMVEADRKRPEAARTTLRQAVDLQAKLLAATPDSRQLMRAQGTTLHNLGNLDRSEKRLKDAEADYLAAVELFRKALTAHPADHEVNFFLGGTLNNLADVQQQLQRPDEARETFTEAVRQLRTAYSALPTNPQYRNNLISSLGNLARAERKVGRLEAADATTQERDRLRRQTSTPQ
jgi:eukaryotic-like serine/threonine-protein kinase